MTERTLDDVKADIIVVSQEIDAQEDRHRRRRALYLEARALGMITRDIAAISKCTKEAVTLQLRKAREEPPRSEQLEAAHGAASSS